jgi:hypothetical protein
MAIPLPKGRGVFDIDGINEQFKLIPGDTSKGLLRTQQLYQQDSDPDSGDYSFGDLTELYFTFPDGGAHWRKSVATFQEIHPVLKSVVIAALTPEPPLEIQWNWDASATAPGMPGIEGRVCDI